MDPAVHIGKRSAAGCWCWDCGITLCNRGNDGIHRSERHEWHDRCPQCGQEPVKESLSDSSVGRELGFNRDAPARKTGVRGCSSFLWAMWPEALEGVDAIEDEYGTRYTRAEFLAVLDECPVQFTHSVGHWFS